MESQRVGHDLVTERAHTHTHTHLPEYELDHRAHDHKWLCERISYEAAVKQLL